MLFRLVRPMKRKGTRNQQLLQRIPADVRERAAGLRLDVPLGSGSIPVNITPSMQTVRFSLRSADPGEVKQRQATAAAYLETVWRALREDSPLPLTHRQAVALAGELYAAWAQPKQRVTALDIMPDGTVEFLPSHRTDDPEEWEAIAPAFADNGEEQLEGLLGPLADRLLLAKGIRRLDDTSRAMLLTALRNALRDAFATRQRNAAGDFRPDDTASRFPAWEDSRSRAKAARSLKGLVSDWWLEAGKSGRSRSTYESYERSFRLLGEFLGHDNAGAVTAADIERFKVYRIGAGVSPKTVGDSDIAALRSVFGWAVSGGKLSSNPAERVKVLRSKQVLERGKGLSREEAATILTHARNLKRGSEKATTFAAKRWVPWLCAYTGARLGEMVQLRKQDVRQVSGNWVVTVTPEAGTVKDKEARDIVLHPHLVEEGFTQFVEHAPDGYLFLKPRNDGEVRGVWRSIKNRVTEFVREVVKDERVAPNHGWRHAFKTVGREAGIEDSVLDGICGHAAKSVGGSYGEVTLKAQTDAMAKFPRYL